MNIKVTRKNQTNWTPEMITPGLVIINEDIENSHLLIAQSGDNAFVLINFDTGKLLDSEPSTAKELADLCETRHYQPAIEMNIEFVVDH